MQSLRQSLPFLGTLFFSFALLLLAGCGTSQIDSYTFESDRQNRAVSENGMVSSAHPLASEAGTKMLEKGGNAVDAAVATAFALNVVEPNMSGIGGGGSMLVWNSENSSADYVDFYPAKRAETFHGFDHDSADEDFNLLSAGVPGTVAGLLEALEKHGTLSREEVMAPAIRHARDGFPVYLTLAQFIYNSEEKLTRYEGSKRLFWPDGEPLRAGEILRQPELASTLQKISDEGASVFYSGEIAERLVEVMNEGGNPVTLEDFHDYEPQWQKSPLCGSYHDYTVLSAPMPQTGVFIIQSLNVLENYDLAGLGMPTESAESFDILASALRLSIADRIEYVSDPNWENIPIDGLISKEYANSRSALVGIGDASVDIEAGDAAGYRDDEVPAGCEPWSGQPSAHQPETVTVEEPVAVNKTNTDEAAEGGETTHISVIDGDGNAVSLSTTLSPVFGSGAWVDGIILNTSGYNFTLMDDEKEWSGAHPYRVRASTISPTIILEEEEVRLVIGAPGGGRIPTAVLQNIVYILDYELDPLDAVNMPRVFPSRAGTDVEIERGFDSSVLQAASEMGYHLQSLSQGYARLYLVYQKDGQLIGVADPRHDGQPRGI